MWGQRKRSGRAAESDFQRVTGHCDVMVIATECWSEDRRFESRESPVGLLVKENYVI